MPLIAAALLASVASQPVRSVRVGNPVGVLDNIGDTWVGAWADDGNLYSPSNDTFGFGNVCDSNLAFNRIDGNDPLSVTGTTVNTMADYGRSSFLEADGCNWKSSGCTCVDGVLYWVVARHKYGETSGDSLKRQTASNASIIMSKDYAKSWSRPMRVNYDHPMFPGSRFATPYFIDYGKGGPGPIDLADRYVYAISNNGFWDNGDDMVLGRVPRRDMGNLRASDWEFFTGRDGIQSGNWARDMTLARPILQEHNHLGMSGATYIPAFGRYLLIGWYYPKGGGKMPGASPETVWDFYESPKPWGPWLKIGSHRFSPQGYYGPNVCLKFAANRGRRVFAVTAGDWHDHSVYRLTLVPLDLG